MSCSVEFQHEKSFITSEPVLCCNAVCSVTPRPIFDFCKHSPNDPNRQTIFTKPGSLRVEGGVWYLTVLISDHCLSFTLVISNSDNSTDPLMSKAQLFKSSLA